MNDFVSFTPCCQFLITNLEGVRFTNLASDHGGATAYGVTQAEYDGYRDSVGFHRQSVQGITSEEAFDCYQRFYWGPACCPALPDGLKLPVFQWAVNHGVAGAILSLQDAAGVAQDGHCGPATLAASQSVSTVAFLTRQRAWYDNHVQLHPDQAVFLDGWHNRIRKVAAYMGIDPTPIFA